MRVGVWCKFFFAKGLTVYRSGVAVRTKQAAFTTQFTLADQISLPPSALRELELELLQPIYR